MKTMLIIGGAGFLGSHLAEKYINEGYIVKVLDDFSSGRVNNIRGLFNHTNFRLIKGDVVDFDTVNNAMRGVDIVFHLAAQVHVDKSIIDASRTFDVNARGTINVLDAMLQNNIELLLYASSSECYGTSQTKFINENHPLNPASPYAASKVAADRMCYAYWNTYKLPIAIIRCFNMYGERQADSGYAAVIPLFIKRVLNNLPPIIYGDGTQSRDYLYYKDALDAYDLVLKNKIVGQAVNFGTGVSITIKELAEKIIYICGKDLVPQYAEKRPGEVARLCADITLARKYGFEPKYDIKKGLEELVRWYKEGRYEGWNYS